MITTETTRGSKTVRRIAVLAVGGLTLGMGASLVSAGGAEALPVSQQTCTTGTRNFTPADGWIPLTPAATVKLSSGSIIKASVAADIGIDSNAEVRLAWAVNGATPVEHTYGPANLANHDEYWETRSSFGLIQAPAGRTRIQPFVRVSGTAGKTGILDTRCFTLEAGTR